MIDELMMNVSLSILSALCPLMGPNLDLDTEHSRVLLRTSG